MYKPLKSWPLIKRYPESINELKGDKIGIDLEWDIHTGRPTILGMSDGITTLGISFGDGREYLSDYSKRHPKTRWVLHNGLQADLPVLESENIHLDPEHVEDTILWWYLTHPNLCKSKKKESDDESEKRGAGFMSIYPMCSIFTDLANWKVCRGELCSGPCPKHDPFGYCAVDSYGPLVALSGMKKLAAIRGVDRLYPLHRDLMVALGKMSAVGVQVDVPVIDAIQRKFEAESLRYWDKQVKAVILPCNPRSSVEMAKHFPELKNCQQETIADCVAKKWPAFNYETQEWVDVYPDEPKPALVHLLDFKELGNGVDRWFAPREWDSQKKEWSGYVDSDGLIHCSFGIFTSSGRLMCTRPNLQNVAVRMGKEVRCAIKAREGHIWYKADYKAAEYRVFLFLSGYRDLPVSEDFHTWVSGLMGISSSDVFAIRMGGPRQAAKSVTFGSLYGEGLQLAKPDNIKRGRIAEEVRAGARIVFPKWTFQDQVVTFTGANLAERAFGSASWANRKKALEFQERFFGRFPLVRTHQMKITKQVEQERAVRPPNGYYMPSYGDPGDRIKTALATWGQQPVAHFSKLAILRGMEAGLGLRLQVHDELDAEMPTCVNTKDVVEMFKYAMCFEVPEMERLKLPIDISCGPSWGACKPIEDVQ